MPAVFGLLSPRVENVHADKLHWGGCYRGYEGARRFFGQFGADINSTLAIDRLIVFGDGVVAAGWTEGTVKATGTAYRVQVADLDGRVTRAQFFVDHPRMRSALEVSDRRGRKANLTNEYHNREEMKHSYECSN